jgi:hypothetical protein
MASGVRKILGADVGVSVTGLAGPDGDEGKPVGLVYVGADTDWGNLTRNFIFPATGMPCAGRLRRRLFALPPSLSAAAPRRNPRLRLYLKWRKQPNNVFYLYSA